MSFMLTLPSPFKVSCFLNNLETGPACLVTDKKDNVSVVGLAVAVHISGKNRITELLGVVAVFTVDIHRIVVNDVCPVARALAVASDSAGEECTVGGGNVVVGEIHITGCSSQY